MTSPSESFIKIDDQAWPLVTVKIQGVVDDDAFRVFLEDYARLLERGERYVVVFDLLDAGHASRAQQKRVGLWMRDNEEAIAAHVFGLAFVIDSMLIQMVFRSILFVSPISARYIVTRDMAEAIDWSRGRLDQASP